MWSCEYIKNRWGLFFKELLKFFTGFGDVSAVKEPQMSNKPQHVNEYAPVPGQKGKDVEWAPCSPVVINRMFEIAKVTPEDFVIDPGSGDGRMVICAAKLGARATGIEYNPRMAELSRKNAEKEGVSDRATFVQGDLFDADFTIATVVAMFLREDINLALRPRILDMKPGTRIVSNIFHMGDWVADEVVKVEDEDYYFKNHTVYFWIVPAKVGGTWKLPDGEMTLEQTFQMIKGALRSGSSSIPINGRMTGDQISFMAGGKQYSGRVAGDLMILKGIEARRSGSQETMINYIKCFD
jgi:hypothetical protein